MTIMYDVYADLIAFGAGDFTRRRVGGGRKGRKGGRIGIGRADWADATRPFGHVC